MGNILDLIRGRTTMEICHPKKISQGGIAYDQIELRDILIFRAILDHICCKAIYEMGMSDGRFQLLSILICRAMSQRIRHKPIYERGIANHQFQLRSNLICGVISNYIRHKTIYKKGIANDLFEKLPEDVLRVILSKLSLKEVVRISALSRKWRCLWTVCPKLSFDGITMCGKNTSGKQQYIQMFIDNVNAVLAQFHGRVVEELAIKFDFDTMLVDHLNNWVSFAVSSRTKFLVFDLAPEDLQGRYDHYIFPFKLLDRGSISRLQKLHLSFGIFQPPAQFNGFPNLRKLDLNLVRVSGKDLPDMLSKCSKLEWLSIVRCHLYDELKVNGPLPCLLYLNVAYCHLTNIAFHAVKLATFEYKGKPVPIELSKSSELGSADIYFSIVTEHAITALANALTNVQHLTFNTSFITAEMPSLMNNPCKFSRLKHLKLKLLYVEDVDSLSLVSYLRSAPFIEKIELHFSVIGFVYLAQDPIRRLPERPFNYMKSLCITGYKASNGQVEFLVHIVENAPALEFLTIGEADKDPLEGDERRAKYVDLVHRTARRYLEGKISPKCTLRLLCSCTGVCENPCT